MINTTKTFPILVPTDLRQNADYITYYILVANSVLLIFIPIGILIILNSLIYIKISKAYRLHNAISANQRRENSVAIMLMIIVLVFIICHSIR